MKQNYGLMLAGPRESTGELQVNSPYSGELIASVAQCGESHIEAALDLAWRTFRDRDNWLDLAARQAILEKAATIMSGRVEQLARDAASEGGKPMVDSLVEANRAVEGMKMCVAHIAGHAGEVIPLKEPLPATLRMGFTQKEPVGVVVAISAFNHPLNLVVHQVGAAIAAGCPVIVKPADDTPVSCLQFVEILREAGLPEAWCQVAIPQQLSLATQLACDKRVAYLSFIGSAKVGWMLRSKLPPGTRCMLEHGGVAPVIVDASADLQKVVPALLKGGFYHAGQVCVSVQRVYVHTSLLDELVESLVAGATALSTGDPLASSTEVGPLVREAEVQRVSQWVSEAVEQGAAKLCGGNSLPGNCYQPTILLNPPADARVSREEVFGPVVCLYSYDDINSAIDAANALPFAFQAAVFAQDIDRALAASNKLDASAVMINDHTAFRQDNMPFGGLRQSGLGIGGIGNSIDDMQVDKLVVIKSSL